MKCHRPQAAEDKGPGTVPGFRSSVAAADYRLDDYRLQISRKAGRTALRSPLGP